jgi:hypothetical protein
MSTDAADVRGGGAIGAVAADGNCGEVAGTSSGAATGGNAIVADCCGGSCVSDVTTGGLDAFCSGLADVDTAPSELLDGADGTDVDAAMWGTGIRIAGTAAGGATASAVGGDGI